MTQDALPSVAAPAVADDQITVLEARIQALQASAEQALTLFLEAPHAAFLVTPQGRIVLANLAGAALLGSGAHVLKGRPLSASVAPSSQAALAALLGRVFGGQGRQTAEVQLAAPQAAPLHVLLTAAPHLRDGEEEPLCQISVTDVSAFKAAHQVLLETTQQQDRHLQQLAARHRQLGEEFRMLTLTSERILSGAVDRAQTLLRQAGTETDPDARQGMLGEASAALHQTQTVLDAVKGYMQARAMRTRVRAVDLNRVLRDVLRDTAAQTAGRHVQVTPTALPTVQGDVQVLRLILHEYVTNALKFTRPRATAELRFLLQETGTEYWVGLQDNGVGFNMRQKDRIFELFGRLHAPETYEGTGLGLAVVRQLCERCGGRAWAEGKVDQGATFWFAWPKAPRPG